MKKVKNNRPVLLLRIESQNDDNKFFPPYGLLYISAALENIGVPSAIFHDYESKELFDKINKYIEENNPLWIGFTVITNKGLLSSLNLTREIKSRFPSIPIVWGGIHPTMCTKQTLQEKAIDFIIINEGEIVAQNFTKELYKRPRNQNFSKILGLAYKKRGKIFINPISDFLKNLDQFKIDFEKISVERYIGNDSRWDGPSFPLITTRGCPFPCRFCYNQVVNKQRWRAHSISFVKEQMKHLSKKYSINNFLFYDDNFFVDRNRGLKIIEYVPKQWMGELRANYFTDEFIKKIKESRCNLAFIGAESGSDRVLKEVVNKCATKEEIVNAIKLSKKYDLNIGISFIIGFPGETREEMFETLNFIYWTTSYYPSANIDIHIFKPYPGTPLYFDALKMGLKKIQTLEEWADERNYQERANNPWVKDEKELENIRDIFSWFITLHKRRKGFQSFIKILSFPEMIRIKTGYYKFPIELPLFNWLKKVYSNINK